MYEFNTTLNMPFDQAVERVREVLMSEHLGIVSDVDVQAVFRNKLEKAIPPYHIFGACNPRLADRVIGAEPNAGVLLPCNFVMREAEDGGTVVSFMDPAAVLALADSDEARAVGDDARDMLQRVMDKLGG